MVEENKGQKIRTLKFNLETKIYVDVNKNRICKRIFILRKLLILILGIKKKKKKKVHKSKGKTVLKKKKKKGANIKAKHSGNSRRVRQQVIIFPFYFTVKQANTAEVLFCFSFLFFSFLLPRLLSL